MSEGKSTFRENTGDSIEELLDELAAHEARAIPENTRRAYETDWRDFARWVGKRNLRVLPATPETVGLYLTARGRTHKLTTIRRRLMVIGKVHRARGHLDPTKDEAVIRAWRGLRRSKGEAVTRKAPTLVKQIRKMMSVLEDRLAGVRDRALLLFGFAGAMRRSELVALNVGDLELTEDGFVVHIRRGKTDQTGKGRRIGIPYGENAETCPVRAMLAWLQVSGLVRGSVFRKVNRHGELEGNGLSPQSVALIVKRTLKAAGISPGQFAAHSLRAGLATSAAMAGVEERAIQEQTGHRSLQVLRTYIRDGSLFRNNAAKKVGL